MAFFASRKRCTNPNDPVIGVISVTSPLLSLLLPIQHIRRYQLLRDTGALVVDIQDLAAAAIEVGRLDHMPAFYERDVAAVPDHAVTAVVIDHFVIIDIEFAAIIRCRVEFIVTIFLQPDIATKYEREVIAAIRDLRQIEFIAVAYCSK